MNFLKTAILGGATAALISVAGAASAATLTLIGADCAIPGEPASGLPGANALDCGNRGDGRDDPNSVNFGAPDGDFFSLGFGGGVSFLVDPDFGKGGTVFEVTFPSNHKEAVNVYASTDGVAWDLITSITNNIAKPNITGASFMITGIYSYIGFVDTTKSVFDDTGSQDGFDLDSFTVQPVPLPAAAFLLLGGLGGLAAMRRKNS